MNNQRRHGSFTARLRSEVVTTATDSAASENPRPQDGYACPRQIKPLLYFYKYLQPLPDGRKIQLNLPATVVCEKRNGREDMVCLSTDANGFVVREDKDPTWRKRILSDFMGEDHQKAASLLAVGVDEVVAVRNVAHWKKSDVGNGSASSSANSKTIVLTRRAFDHVINAPTELAFSVQRYVRCRGSHASIFRVTWSERDSCRFAINIFNDHKISEASSSVSSRKTASGDDVRPRGTPLEVALQQMTELSPYYCVSSTSERDGTKQPQLHKIPKVRGSPVAEGVDAVKRIADHLTSQLPGIKVRTLTADFIKDSRGTWWFIRAVRFDASYRVEIPPYIREDPTLDSAVIISDSLRCKRFRQSLRTFTPTAPENPFVSHCSLCSCSCELPKDVKDELQGRDEPNQFESRPSDVEVFNALSEYRMTLKMVFTALFQFRQRGQVLATWEHAAMLLMKTPAGQASEFAVCYLCYKIYKSQLQLARVAMELNEAFGICRPVARSTETQGDETSTFAALEESDQPTNSISRLQMKIKHFNQETCMTSIANDDEMSVTGRQLVRDTYTPVTGIDIDPTALQVRLVFFFHELQDGGPDISPSDFYLEYHLGQQFTRLDFEGSKCHTPNRWQLCEARVHYLLSTKDGFSDFCSDKRLCIKMKTVQGDEYHGHTSMSLRPLLSAAKWYGNSMQRESRLDYLMELKTDAFGLLTLKLTVGLLVDAVPLSQVRELIKDDQYIQEEPFGVFWPPPAFHSCSLVVPVDWIGALSPSEYMSVVPMRNRRSVTGRRRVGYAAEDRNDSAMARIADTKSPSQRFSIESQAHASPGVSPVTTNAMGTRKTSASLPSSSPHLIASVVVVVKRLIHRVAGEVATFSTFLLAQILRHASFLAHDDGLEGVASWTESASLELSNKYTIDTIFAEIPPASNVPLCVVGEMLLVLLGSQLVPAEIPVRNIESTLSPYWLIGEGCEDPTAFPFQLISPRLSAVPSHQRMVWNRAIRRCQVEHFCPEFRAFDRNVHVLDRDDEQIHGGRTIVSKYEEMLALRRKMSYRAKVQAHVLCALFEHMEASDSGYIEIAELRSLHNSVSVTKPHAKTEVVPTVLYQDHSHLPQEALDALSVALINRQEVMEAALVRCLVESELMRHALAQFDQLGCGAMSFVEFWGLAETVFEACMSTYGTAEEEPTCKRFCLRHGNAEAYALDSCCLQCSFQYQDQDMLPQHLLIQQGERQGVVSDDNDDGSASNSDDAGNEQSGSVAKKHSIAHKGVKQHEVDHSNDGGHSDPRRPFDEPALVDTLQRLEAAEWHVRYRRESLGHATLAAALTDRRSSAATVRRSSAASTLSETVTRKSTMAPSFSVADFVSEAELRKQQAFASEDERPQGLWKPKKTKKQATVTNCKEKRKPVSSSVLRSTRLQSSHSLSTLLRFELEDASRQLHLSDATRSTKLIETVHRSESKRKKLDRLVLAELDDVKQRLARLFQTT